ncbi:hypothetical protein AA14337_2143 [Acetobacter malorum DSM 14337]|uniref:Uncharacterized protein n=1 Tax=Acetobacter malorum DSM 14337 TaxID=1307910 RepID=A0ABQ0PUN1_9PROT|nr:hypothetical protein AA14337_2143 [Acetobacter malorum DSM 14337]
MHMLAFREEHLHQVALNTGLHRHVGDGYNRTKFRQNHRHGAGFDDLHGNRLNRAAIGRGMAAGMLACCGRVVRAQEGKRQHADANNGNAAPEETLFPA